VAPHIQPSTTHDILRRLKDGDRQAFRALYDEHKNRVYSVCVRMLVKREDAEDACQEAFVRAFRGIGAFRGESSLPTWLHRIAANVCIEHLRSAKRDRFTDSIDDPDRFHNPPLAAGEPVDVKVALDREIGLLPEGCRAVFVLHVVEGYKHTEIADMLGIGEGASKSRLAEAKERLRERLSQRLEVLSDGLQ